MKYVISKPEKYGKHPAIKISDTNVGKGEGFITYPLYYCGFLEYDYAQGTMSAVDIGSLKVPEQTE